MSNATFKGTAGDWGVEDPMDHCLTIVANPEAPVDDWIWVATCDWPDEESHLVTAAQVKANARLLAAAPATLRELQALYRAYVRLLEAGRDRIIDHGGTCDPVDVMEEGDPALIKARAAISKALDPTGSAGGAKA